MAHTLKMYILAISSSFMRIVCKNIKLVKPFLANHFVPSRDTHDHAYMSKDIICLQSVNLYMF